MADNRDPNEKKEWREGYDPEFEIPDPEQVDKDIERAEKEYGKNDGEKKKPAA